MSNLHILREHALGLPKARKIAFAWAEQVEREFNMECTYEEGSTEDVVAFVRSGVHGMLHVTAKLGLLLGAFKGRIEAEIVKNLDDLLAPKAAHHAGAAHKHPAKKK